MESRQDLLNKIQILEFVTFDAALFLDTHPTDQAALCYYHNYRKMLDAAVDEYAACYGPLTLHSVLSTNNWTWIEHPWPWEMGA